MANKKILGFNMILVAVTLVISLVAFSFINNSRAWFVSDNTVNGFGLNVSPSIGANITASVRSYGVVDVREKDTVFVLGNKDSQGNRPEIYDLPVVDPNNISYSQYEKALVVMLELVSTNDVNIDIMLNTPNDTPIFTEENHFSNCIKVANVEYNDAQGTAVKDPLDSKSFISISNGVCSKITSITLSQSVSLKKDVPTSLCYVIEYNSEYIDYINQYILEKGLLINEIDYTNDIVFSIIESIS